MPHGVQLRDLGHVEELQRFMWRRHSLPNPISLNQNFSGGGAVHAVARSGRLQRRPVSDACADASADPFSDAIANTSADVSADSVSKFCAAKLCNLRMVALGQLLRDVRRRSKESYAHDDGAILWWSQLQRDADVRQRHDS